MVVSVIHSKRTYAQKTRVSHSCVYRSRLLSAVMCVFQPAGMGGWSSWSMRISSNYSNCLIDFNERKHSFGLLPLALMVTVVVTMMMKLRVGARRVPNSCSTPVLPQGNVLTRTRTRHRDTSFSTSKTVFINLYLDVDLIARTL